MKTMMVGALTVLSGMVMYPFWLETAVLGPFWSSAVVIALGLSIFIGGALLTMKR